MTTGGPHRHEDFARQLSPHAVIAEEEQLALYHLEAREGLRTLDAASSAY